MGCSAAATQKDFSRVGLTLLLPRIDTFASLHGTSGDMAPMCREKKRSCHPQILSDAAEWLDTNPLS